MKLLDREVTTKVEVKNKPKRLTLDDYRNLIERRVRILNHKPGERHTGRIVKIGRLYA